MVFNKLFFCTSCFNSLPRQVVALNLYQFRSEVVSPKYSSQYCTSFKENHKYKMLLNSFYNRLKTSKQTEVLPIFVRLLYWEPCGTHQAKNFFAAFHYLFVPFCLAPNSKRFCCIVRHFNIFNQFLDWCVLLHCKGVPLVIPRFAILSQPFNYISDWTKHAQAIASVCLIIKRNENLKIVFFIVHINY